MKLTTAAFGFCLTAALVAGCANSSTSTSPDKAADVISGGTFTLGLGADPGNLDPQLSAASALFTVTGLAYDPLVSVDAKTGAVQSALATTWELDKTKAVFTLSDAVTCSDGTKLTASMVADNLNFVADPANKSPFLGTFLPVDAKAKADDANRTVTLTWGSPAPFVLNGLASLPIVCPAGMKDRKALAGATQGTGPYQLSEAAPGDHYTYTLRQGYTWGPGGATTATKGLPATIVVKVVENETTAANLLLSGGLSAAQVNGPDAKRLEKSKLFVSTTSAINGEQWYNHAKGRVTSDPDVRMALTQGLDLAKLQQVLTAGQGTPATTLAAGEPVACPGDSVSASLPKHDAAAAAALLDKAGWTAGSDGVRAKDGKPLKVTLIYQSNLGAGASAAAELAVQEWKEIGVAAVARSQEETALTQTIFGGGDWDAAWVPLNVSSPDQLVAFLSGPAAPNGTNFSDIQNTEYQSAVTSAMAIPGTEGCKAWLAAESGLIAKAEIVPFANTVVRTFGAKATFDAPGRLVPLSIRMLAK